MNDNYLRFFQFLVIISFKFDKRTKYILILISIFISSNIITEIYNNTSWIQSYQSKDQKSWLLLYIQVQPTATWLVEVHHQHLVFLNLPKLPQDCSNIITNVLISKNQIILTVQLSFAQLTYFPQLFQFIDLLSIYLRKQHVLLYLCKKLLWLNMKLCLPVSLASGLPQREFWPAMIENIDHWSMAAIGLDPWILENIIVLHSLSSLVNS